MPINELSVELLVYILEHLWVTIPPLEHERAIFTVKPRYWSGSLCQARLVCRQWNLLCMPILFSHATLESSDLGYNKWEGLLQNQKLCSFVRHIELNSEGPCKSYTIFNVEPELETRDTEWEVRDMNVYRDAVAQGATFPQLNSVSVRLGPTSLLDPTSSKREDLLSVVFAMIVKRQHQAAAANNDSSRNSIRRLAIFNMAEDEGVSHDLATTDLFRAATSSVTDLCIHICPPGRWYEYEDYFPPWNPLPADFGLSRSWLPPLAEQLTSLTIRYTHLHPAPPDHRTLGLGGGRTAASSLLILPLPHMPSLRSLTLANLALIHDRAFDPVVRQTSLRRLVLEDCAIASHVRIQLPPPPRGAPASSDEGVVPDCWTRLPAGSFGFSGGPRDGAYTFGGTWASVVFDRLRREELPLLGEVRAAWLRVAEAEYTPTRRWEPLSRRWEAERKARDEDLLSAGGCGPKGVVGLFSKRYVTFDTWFWKSWAAADMEHFDELGEDQFERNRVTRGKLDFGNGDPGVYFGTEEKILGYVNRHAETTEEDTRAWNALQEHLRARN